MNLEQMLEKEHIWIADEFPGTDNFYSGFSEFLKEKKIVDDSDKVKRLFIKREKIHTTAIGKGAAAPHIYSSEFSEFIFSVTLIKKGLDFKAPDKKNVFVVFLLMSDERDVPRHLKSLAHIARLVETTDIIENLKKSENVDDLFQKLKEYDWRIA